MIKLSPTELRAMTDAANGLTAEEAATLHGVSRRTIEQQRVDARVKLAARSTTQAVALLIRQGRL